MANFELILKICPNLKQALKALNSDSSLVKSFVDHISKYITSSVAFMTTIMFSCQQQQIVHEQRTPALVERPLQNTSFLLTILMMTLFTRRVTVVGITATQLAFFAH